MFVSLKGCENDDCPHTTKEKNDKHQIVVFHDLKPATNYEVNLITVAGDKYSNAIRLNFKTGTRIFLTQQMFF